MTKLEGLTRFCPTCGVNHSVGYLCAHERKVARMVAMYPVMGTPTVAIRAKGTK